MVDIAVEPRDGELEPVNLGDSSYEFAYPKVSPLLNAQQKALTLPDAEKAQIMMGAQEKWMATGFGPNQWAHIQSRLEDDGDPLDFPHMQQLFEALFAKAAQSRPPTWRGDSSRVSPQAFRREAVPSPSDLTSGSSLLADSVTS